jgi:hypothetical protein
MKLIEYIEHRYGVKRGNRQRFLEYNPHITGSELSRWIRKGYHIDVFSGDIFKPSKKKVNL